MFIYGDHVFFSAVFANLSLMYSVDTSGREFACDEEDVVFTCTLLQRSGLQWVAPPFISLAVPIAYGASDTSPGVNDRSPFYALLTDIQPDTFPNANFTSTLQVQASSVVNGTAVQCRSQDQQLSEQINLTLSSKLVPSILRR